MFEKILEEKSNVFIENGTWKIRPEYSEENQIGSSGRNDLIRRQDAVRLIGEMNIKLSKIYDQAKTQNPALSERLLEATEPLSYAMWGIRELETAEKPLSEYSTDELLDEIKRRTEKNGL